jgi:uncharacterized protein with FMN-binding domain
MSLTTLVVIGMSVRASSRQTESSDRPSIVAAAPSGSAQQPAPRPSSRPAKRKERAGTSPKSTRTEARTVTVRGDLVDTAYGPVQVELTVSDGRITAAHAPVHPQGHGQTQEINSAAIPVLDREVVDAQSAGIDTVSGATFTSGGYLKSLQSALDDAHREGVL